MNTEAWIGKKVLVRDHRAGVHVGELVSLDVAAKACELRNARKIWYWHGAGSVHGIAAHGLNQTKSKIAPPVSSVLLTDVVEVVECSEAGLASVMGAPEWRP